VCFRQSCAASSGLEKRQRKNPSFLKVRASCDGCDEAAVSLAGSAGVTKADCVGTCTEGLLGPEGLKRIDSGRFASGTKTG
jgi:hypothetical protein